MDLRLEGLDPFHAEVRSDEHDEYVLYVRGKARKCDDHLILHDGFQWDHVPASRLHDRSLDAPHR